MPLRIHQHGEPVFRKKGVTVTAFDGVLKAFADNLIEAMYANPGCIGLAAHQVGRAIQLCVVDVLPREGRETYPSFDYCYDGKKPPLEIILPMIIVNPKLEHASENQVDHTEGSPTLPGISAIISRPESIRIAFQDFLGEPHSLECTGILARCIQHEMDHLDGLLFIDRMHVRDLERIKTKLKQLKRASKRVVS